MSGSAMCLVFDLRDGGGVFWKFWVGGVQKAPPPPPVGVGFFLVYGC